MSDTGRESFTDKASSALKPDSQKTGTEQAGDTLKGKTDSITSTLQPESHKSTSQKAGDTLSGNSNNNDQSMLDKAKDSMSLASYTVFFFLTPLYIAIGLGNK
ncbi:hypothetical protein K439DRAFT_1353500 [Ramaria rubella]|nr:hypothetical protein K439DRAFT_1353500 [Ramaria rubella]